MLIVKGVNIFPLQIDKVLMARPEVGTHTTWWELVEPNTCPRAKARPNGS